MFRWLKLTGRLDAIASAIGGLVSSNQALHNKVNKLMASMDEVRASVAAEKTVVGSAVALLQGLKAKLDEAGTDPAALDAIKADIDNQTQALSAAVLQNTPAAATEPTPAVAPANA